MEVMKVPRPYALNDEDLKKHIRAIGETITEGADRMNIRACGTMRITIKAEICPAERATTVEWEIEEYADPRIKKGRSEE